MEGYLVLKFRPYEFNSLLYTRDYFPGEVLNSIKAFPLIENQFKKRVTNHAEYTLQDHTLSVMRVFEKYFAQKFDIRQRNSMRLLLAFHDIGKPLAISRGNKKLQHGFTQRCIRRIPDHALDERGKNWLCAILQHDYLGDCLKGNTSEVETVLKLNSVIQSLNCDKEAFFHCLSVYYQCDVAGYSRLGDLTCALDILFKWDASKKHPIYNKESCLFEFSEAINIKFLNIKNLFLVGVNNG